MSYRLVVHDDATHTFDYVTGLFTRVLGVNSTEAHRLAWRIHQDGEASFNFYELATAREAEERLLSAGPDERLRDSVTTLVVEIQEVTDAKTKTVSQGRVGPRGYERLDDMRVMTLHFQSHMNQLVQNNLAEVERAYALRRLAYRRSPLRRLLRAIIALGLLALLMRALFS